MPLREFHYPYRLEQVPPHSWQVDGRTVELSVGWRLERKQERFMIRVKLGNRTLGITFQRETIEPSANNPRYVRATWCELHRLAPDGKTEAIVARSYAKCAKRDRFSLESGRKLALARALKQYSMKREERTIVWNTYLDRPRPVSKPKAEAVKVQPAEPVLDLDLIDGSQQADGFLDVDRDRHIHSLDLHAGEVH